MNSFISLLSFIKDIVLYFIFHLSRIIHYHNQKKEFNVFLYFWCSLDNSITNEQGVSTFIVNCNEWGLFNYSLGNSNCFIKVTGWRTCINNSDYEVKYNQELVSATIHLSALYNFSTTLQEFGAEVLKDGNIDLRPKMPMSFITQNGNIIQIRDNSYRFGYWRLSGTSANSVYATFTYARR